MYTHITRRHISALLPLDIRYLLTRYLCGHAPHSAIARHRAHVAYLVATGRLA